MKFILFFPKILILILCLVKSWQCSSQKVELDYAQSQNIDFLIAQAKMLWEQRSDSVAVKNANHFLGLAYDVDQNNPEILSLYSKSLFFQGMFLEKDNKTKDSLFLKGSEISKTAVLSDLAFKQKLNNSIGDSSFKIISSLSEAPKELVPVMYWWATNKLWYLNNKAAIERINHRELLEVIMHRVISLEPEYDQGGAYRFFGVFYSRIPGVELNQSKVYFEKAITSAENYFGNKVQKSEFYYQKAEDKSSFITLLQSVISLDASIYPEVMADNMFYQERAKLLLKQQDTLFE
ncbi:TRAP transporter TatT component family protein [Candidatus Marinimicrobia bacterium]|nr:TRAP transporter TatT component family protein [Candidatus Neomarinimicrobiota bacterium]